MDMGIRELSIGELQYEPILSHKRHSQIDDFMRHILKSIKLSLIVWIGFFLIFWATGCTSVPSSQENSLSTVSETESQMTLLEKTHILAVTATPRFTSTHIPTFTQTLTVTPIPSPTLTLPATLEPVQASAEIRVLLESPQNCPFPCFWGIIPNITTLGEANNLFTRLRAPLRSFEENIFTASPRFDQLPMIVNLEVQDGLVKRVNARIVFDRYKGPDILHLMAAFSPTNLIRLYGKPSQVEFSIFYPTEPGFPEGIAWYGMILRFDQYPFAVNYFESEVRDGKYINVCPLTDKFTTVEPLIGYDPATYRSKGIFGMPLEKITSLNMDQFVELMTEENGLACFDLNAEVYNNQ